MDIYLDQHSQTFEPNAELSWLQGDRVSGPCSPPPSPLGFGIFDVVPMSRDAALCLRPTQGRPVPPTMARLDQGERTVGKHTS